MKCKSAEMVALSPDWAPWTHQVNTFGPGELFGRKAGTFVRSGMANFTSLKAAEAFLARVS